MNRTIAFSGVFAQPFASIAGRIAPLDLARRLIVLGCAAALILSGQTLPF